jgi:hypothetical protein
MMLYCACTEKWTPSPVSRSSLTIAAYFARLTKQDLSEIEPHDAAVNARARIQGYVGGADDFSPLFY